MAKIRKTVTAGPYQKVILYSRGHRGDGPKARASKRRASSEAQRRLNLKNSREQLKLMLAANFPIAGSGLVFVLTYRDECLPANWDAAGRCIDDFRRRMRRELRKLGKPFLMINNTEEHSAKLDRIHHHAVVNATGEDYDRIRRCWVYGDVLEIQKLRVDKEKNWTSLARYMTKEQPEKIGKHGWSATRSCRRPEVETSIVPDDETLQAPHGAHLINSERHADEWSAWEAIEFVWPNAERAPRAKRRKNRRRAF